MKHQHQILRTLQSASAQSRLAPLFADEALTTQTALARAVCREFGFVDAHGKASRVHLYSGVACLGFAGLFHVSGADAFKAAWPPPFGPARGGAGCGSADRAGD